MHNTSQTGEGGGLSIAESSDLAMHDDCNVSDNKAHNGGGIWIANTVDNSSWIANTGFYGNVATNNGGGIYLGKNAVLSISGVDIEENKSAADGGGLYQESGTLQTGNLAIRYNQAGGWGGGFFILAGEVTLNISSLLGNTAADYEGGAICRGVTVGPCSNAGPQSYFLNVVP